jgi:hypothetical protein
MRPGPINKRDGRIGGRIWARAFTDPGFSVLLEESPSDAASTFLLERVIPLYKTRGPTAYIRFFMNYLDANFTNTERQQIRDNTFPKTDPRYIQLANKLNGNLFTLFENTIPIYNTPLEQDILGPQGADKPLTRDEWVRVYAKAYLESKFRDRLEDDPASAVEEFDALGHNAGAPIFKFPSFNELLAKIPATHPLKDPVTLAMTLHRIASGSDPDYEAVLEITLSC